MTDQPFPPPPPGGGDYPPPPPSAGGYAPPPPGPAIRSLPKAAYTPWLTRVGAYLIDNLPFVVILGVGRLVLQNSVESACLIETGPGGPVQVCENDGATWLPFEPLSIVGTHRERGYTAEAVCEMEN